MTTTQATTASRFLFRADDGKWRIECANCAGTGRLYYVGEQPCRCKLCGGKGRVITNAEPRE